MTEYSVQPNIRSGGLPAVAGAPILPAMARRGPTKRTQAKPRRHAASNYVKAWRIERDLTVDELADLSGVSNGQISDIENEKGGYSPESLDKLAKALKVDKGTLLTVSPTDVGAFWPLWHAATPIQREQLTIIAKTIIKPR